MFVRAIKAVPAYVRLLKNYALHRLSGCHRDFVTATFFGSRVAGNIADNLPRKLFLFGIWEPNLTYWIREQLRPGDTFVDVGANFGYYSLLASKLVGSAGNVIAIEASPSIVAGLKRNLDLNKTRNVRVIEKAVSDTVGTLSFYRGPAGWPGQNSFIKGANMTYECDVSTAPLCGLLAPAEIAAARIMKIDVEGGECAAIAGLMPCLRATRSDLEIALEVNPCHLASLGQSAEELIAVMAGAGFHAYRILNEYAGRSYLPPLKLSRPQRLREPLTGLTDMVFSRRDQAAL